MTTLNVCYYQVVNECDRHVWRFDIGDRTGINTPELRETLALAGADREQVDTFVDVLNGITHTFNPALRHTYGFPIPA